MKTAKRFVLSLSALLLISGAALAAPAAARADIADSNTGTQTKTEVEAHANDLAEQFKTQAKATLAEKKAQVKERTQEQRQKSCEARKTNLTKRMANAVTHAQNHKAVFDKIYTRVQDFYTNKHLDVADYAALTAKVDAAQADAAAKITALQELDVSVNCTSSTVADSVSAFQTAVGSTRDSLKAYRTSITELIKALKGASTSTDKTTDTSTDNQTNQ